MHALSILYALFLHGLDSSLFSLVCAWHKLLHPVLNHWLQIHEDPSRSVGTSPSHTACPTRTAIASSVQNGVLLLLGWLDSSFGRKLWQRRNSISKIQAKEHLESTNMNMNSVYKCRKRINDTKIVQ